MLVLGRSKGERIEIEGCALIRVARIEEHRVRLDITAPFSRAQRAEQAVGDAADRTAVVTVLGIRHRAGSPILRASIGIRVPVGATVRRAEVAQQLKPMHERFPWHRFRPIGRYWRSVNEEIYIELP